MSSKNDPKISQHIFIHQRIYQAFYGTEARFIAMESGRGAGKSTQSALIVILEAMKKKIKVLCIRGFQKTLRNSSLAVLKKAIALIGCENEFIITENSLTGKNGSEFIFSGAQNPYSWKSLDDIDLAFIDEATELDSEAWDILLPTLREEKCRSLICYNPTYADDPAYIMFHLEAGKEPFPLSVTVNLNWRDNPFFQENQKILMEYDKRTNYQRYLHIWEGELKVETEGALFQKEWIRYTSIHLPLSQLLEQLEKIIVAIDPSVSSKETSDPCGLVVAGKFIDTERYIILEDQTKIQSPYNWASEAISLYKKYKANFIVYEKNQGGDAIKTVFDLIDKKVKIIDVWAKKGKLLRAEPVAMLYEKNLVEHYKIFPALEGQMITFKGKRNEESPNNLDAMVYSLLYLIDEEEAGYSKLEYANSGSDSALIDPLVLKNTKKMLNNLKLTRGL